MKFDPSIKKSLNTIILVQCLWMTGVLLIGNGFVLAYLSRLGIPGYRILFLLSLLPFISMLLTLPLSYCADCFGKKKIGMIGGIFSAIGFAMLPIAGYSPKWADQLVLIGILLYSIGGTVTGSSWFALLSPIIPKEIRGVFFARLRMSFRTFGILFAIAVAALLKSHPETSLFKSVLFVITVMIVVRFFLYLKIPELEPAPGRALPLRRAMAQVIRAPGYLPFCSYQFLLSLFTGCIPWVLSLLQKDVLGFSDSQLVTMGILITAGAIAGFYCGGKLVDAFSPRPVFVGSHMAFAVILAAFAFRDFIPLPTGATLATLSILFGAVQAAQGIACSSEMLALIPPEGKSLSTGLLITMSSAGLACSGMLSGQIIKLQVLQTQWTLLDQTLSCYDTILLGCSIMLALLTVTIGLVPSVIGTRSQWMPQQNR